MHIRKAFIIRAVYLGFLHLGDYFCFSDKWAVFIIEAVKN
jgi:hypothetical protein